MIETACKILKEYSGKHETYFFDLICENEDVDFENVFEPSCKYLQHYSDFLYPFVFSVHVSRNSFVYLIVLMPSSREGFHSR